MPPTVNTSQRDAVRKPSSAQKEASNARMPFEAAEALLWGKVTYDQHQLLYGRMQKLEEQQQATNTRIQTTEAISEAAEAATSRVRRIEQQIAAIEADDNDKPFDIWVTAELQGLKAFIEKHKDIRQKHIELERLLSNVLDDLNAIRDVSIIMKDLPQRIEAVESRSNAESNRLKELEKQVTNLTETRNIHATEDSELHTQFNGRQAISPSRQRDPVISDMSEDTVDEGYTAHPTSVEQVPRGLEVEATSRSTGVVPSPFKARNDMSARLRMMQRKSIHEPKKHRGIEQQHSREVAPLRKHQGQQRSTPETLPATQIVDRSDTTNQPLHLNQIGSSTAVPSSKHLLVRSPVTTLEKRKRANENAIPRLTRSRAQAQKNDQGRTGGKLVAKGKEKLDSLSCVQSDTTISKNALPLPETQIVGEPTNKRKKLNMHGSQISEHHRAPGKAKFHAPEENAVAFAVAPLRKAAPATKTRSCARCRTRKIKCDRIHPACGNCKKLPQPGACVYMEPNKGLIPLDVPASSSATKDDTKADPRVHIPVLHSETDENPLRESSRTVSPEKFAVSTKRKSKVTKK